MREVKLSDLVAKLLEEGVQPARIRRQLAAKGIHWSYQYTAHAGDRRVSNPQGLRECARRARSLKLCSGGCGKQGITNEAQMCDDCLTAKWAARG